MSHNILTKFLSSFKMNEETEERGPSEDLFPFFQNSLKTSRCKFITLDHRYLKHLFEKKNNILNHRMENMWHVHSQHSVPDAERTTQDVKREK